MRAARPERRGPAPALRRAVSPQVQHQQPPCGASQARAWAAGAPFSRSHRAGAAGSAPPHHRHWPAHVAAAGHPRAGQHRARARFGLAACTCACASGSCAAGRTTAKPGWRPARSPGTGQVCAGAVQVDHLRQLAQARPPARVPPWWLAMRSRTRACAAAQAGGGVSWLASARASKPQRVVKQAVVGPGQRLARGYQQLAHEARLRRGEVRAGARAHMHGVGIVASRCSQPSASSASSRSARGVGARPSRARRRGRAQALAQLGKQAQMLATPPARGQDTRGPAHPSSKGSWRQRPAHHGRELADINDPASAAPAAAQSTRLPPARARAGSAYRGRWPRGACRRAGLRVQRPCDGLVSCSPAAQCAAGPPVSRALSGTSVPPGAEVRLDGAEGARRTLDA